MSETAIKDAILRWLREQGCYAVKIHGGASQEAGTPDILCCWAGSFIAIEVKMPGKKPTKIQAYQLERIRYAEGIAFVTDSLEDCKAQLELWGVI